MRTSENTSHDLQSHFVSMHTTPSGYINQKNRGKRCPHESAQFYLGIRWVYPQQPQISVRTHRNMIVGILNLDQDPQIAFLISEEIYRFAKDTGLQFGDLCLFSCKESWHHVFLYTYIHSGLSGRHMQLHNMTLQSIIALQNYYNAESVLN